MAAKQIDIMKIKQLLLLKSKGVSNRKIARETSVDRNTVNEYVIKLQSSDKSYAELLKLSEVELQSLFPSKEAIDKERYEKLLTLFPGYLNELKKPGCTRLTLWHTYQNEHKDHYSYSQFCLLFSHWQDSKKISGKLTHISGDKLYIDYTGKKLQIVDKTTGDVQDVEVFVAILPASQYTYVEASRDQTRESLVKSVSNALSWIGGVPQSIVPDNLKSAVTKSSKYEPVINKTFRDMGDHYGCVINPTRAYSPQDKALVESAVKLVYQRIFYPLLKMTFFSLKDLNKQIQILLKKYNDFSLQTTGVSRYKQFIDFEKELLLPLPAEPYVVKHYNRAKVQKMGYVYLNEQKNYYSVPYRFIGKQVEIQHTTDTVEVFYNKERIALHPKSYRKGNYITNNEHLSSTHKFVQEWSKEFFVKKAAPVGLNTAEYIAKLIDTQQYPETGYKQSMGILSLKKYYSSFRIETACKKALKHHRYAYSIIKNMLKNNADLEQESPSDEHDISPHENLRKAGTYK